MRKGPLRNVAASNLARQQTTRTSHVGDIQSF